MTELRIRLLGPPAFWLDGRPRAITRNKSIAVCAYLALHEGGCRRDTLAALLWPELSQSRARADLRRELTFLRDVLGATSLIGDRETVALGNSSEVRVDVLDLRSLITSLRLGHADAGSAATHTHTLLSHMMALYQGDFLDGFTLRDAPEFDTWQYFTAEELRREFAWSLETLLVTCRERNDIEGARKVAQRRLALDPLDERAHQTLIELHLLAGDRSAALHQYDQCVRMLEQELEAPPSAELVRIAESIRKPRIVAAGAANLAALAATAPPGADAEIQPIVALSLSILPGGPISEESALAQAATGALENSAARCQELLQRAGATITFSSIDSFLALFGLAAPAEDDAERCVRCAFDLRLALQGGLGVAIGIASGLAFVKSSAAAGALSSIVMGPALNLAADLQRLASAGDVFVDRTTHLLTKGTVQYGAPEAAAVHGRLITFFRGLGLSMEFDIQHSLADQETPLIGRDCELEQLQAALASTCRGEGRIVFLSGEAGLGKSRLVMELKKRCPPSSSVQWYIGRCRESTTSVSYWPFTEMVRLFWGWQPDADQATRVLRIKTGLLELQRAGVLDSIECDEITAVLGILYAVQPGDERDERLRTTDPREMHQRTLGALTRLLLARCRQQPHVLVLEDLHWADALSLDLIRSLLVSLANVPMLLICVYRPDAHSECARLRDVAAHRVPNQLLEIRLHELSHADTGKLIDSRLGAHCLPADLIHWIQAHAQGNPFFAEETVLSLTDSGVIECVQGVWRPAHPDWESHLGQTSTSPGIDNLMLSRLGRLEPELRKVLRAASVLGVSFAAPLLAQLLPGVTALTAQLHALEARDILRSERSKALQDYSFRHVLWRDAIYKTLPQPNRAELHLMAAHAIEAHFADNIEAQVEQLAQHYLKTDDHDAAVRYLVRAGAKARRSFHNQQALAFFRLAIQRCARLAGDGARADTLALQAELWHQIGRVEYAIGAFASSEQAFRTVAELGSAAGWDVHALVRNMYWLGEALYWQDKDADLEMVADAGLAMLGEEVSVETVMMLGHKVAAVCALGRPDDARRVVARMQPLVQKFEFSEELSPAYHHVIDHLMDYAKDAKGAQAWISELAARAETRHDLNSLAKARYIEVTLQECCGEFERARIIAQEMLALVSATGERTLAYFCLSRLAEIALFVGDVSTAANYGRQILGGDTSDAAPDMSMMAQAGYIALGAGEPGIAVELLEKALHISADVAPSLLQEALLWLARARCANDEMAAAAETYKRCLMMGRPSLATYSKMPLFRAPLASILAGLERTMCDRTAFRGFCAELVAANPAFHDPIFRHWSLTPSAPWPDSQQRATEDGFAASSSTSAWTWFAPHGGTLLEGESGFLINAPEGCDLWHLNLNAPRLSRAIEGDFSLQVTCEQALHGLPMGGLCLWGDERDFLRLDCGALGEGEITLLGSLSGLDCMIGRGRLSDTSIRLRIERRGTTVRGLCSAGGETWWLVGECEWQWRRRVDAGLYVIGLVDRTLYPGVARCGGALVFRDPQLWL